jgi:hypothetical protein
VPQRERLGLGLGLGLNIIILKFFRIFNDTPGEMKNLMDARLKSETHGTSLWGLVN